jgi:epoxyqueuosine reductase
MEKNFSDTDLTQLAHKIKQWGHEFGFQQVAISDTELRQAEQYLQKWLAGNFHGEMHYMQKHGTKRTRPAELVPGTARIITARMNYMPANTRILQILRNPNQAYISRYALGRDYHKVIRARLHKLAKKINEAVNDFQYRAFVDSAPVMEKAIAAKAGLGWIGKNTLLLNRQAGSWFFLGELYTNIPLPVDQPVANHCGSCTACLDICPTQALIAPYQLDARLCISYLTIESQVAIPEHLRRKIGNRIFGCDDCQLVCPWNKYAKFTDENDFHPRHHLESADLITLFAWSESEFNCYTEGSAIRRAGYEGWLRNIAVALGNAPTSAEIINVLRTRQNHPSELVKEHVEWALAQHFA